MSIKNNFRHTVFACYMGYITQAIINNLLPLLFITFNKDYGISFEQLGLLVAVNFGTQLTVDLICAKFIDKIGYRPAIVSAHILAAAGLIGLAVLPEILPDPYTGLMICILIYAVGGGLTETLISPIVEACPSDKKSAAMSLLHSFYCWGSVLVVLLSTAFFAAFGIGCWRYVALGWAVLPILNSIYFSIVPINRLTEKGEGMRLSELFSSKLFWVFALLMLGAGATELSIAQWVSAFAEKGLAVEKSVGDIAGPCAFALLMGISRVLHSKISDKIELKKYIFICALGCIGGYLIAALSPLAALSLIGCGICGFSVGIMWPGVFSLASVHCPTGGTAMFALLALFGDLGCGVGPGLVGAVSSAMGDQLNLGIAASTVFPILIVVGLAFLAATLKRKKKGDL